MNLIFTQSWFLIILIYLWNSLRWYPGGQIGLLDMVCCKRFACENHFYTRQGSQLQSPIFIRSSRKKFWIPSDGLSCLIRKSANLHIQDGRHRLICISNIDDRRKRSPVANNHPILPIFFLSTFWWIILVELKKSANLHNQHGRHGLICISEIDVNSRQYASDIRNFFS